MNKTLRLLMIVALLLSGCASKWALVSETPGAHRQWSDASGRSLIEHVATIKGFRETGSSPGSALRSLVFGSVRNSPLAQPLAVAVGHDGRMAVVDAGCACVHLFTPGEQRYQRIFGSSAERLRSPVAAAFDGGLRLYVSDSAAGAVFVFSPSGYALDVLRQAGHEKLSRPTGLAYSLTHEILYLADTGAHKVHALGNRNELLYSIGGRGSEQGKFNFPTHLYSSESGILHVTDSMNFRVQRFDASGGFLSSFGRHGDGSGDFAMPKGVVADREGIVYIVDSLFDNVQLFNQKGEFLLTLGSRGNDAGEFWLPSGLFLDRQEKLYVCDRYNQRIQVFQIVRRGHD